MSATTTGQTISDVPAELRALRDRVQALPPDARDELGPLMDDVLEQAVYRSRVLTLARDALARYRLELAAARFDLEATRRERDEALRGAARA